MISRYITADVTEKVITLLDEFATGQLGNSLSWAHLEKAFGYSRQALSTNQTIKAKFQETKKSLKDSKRKVSNVLENETENKRLRAENAAQKIKLEEYEKRFIRWTINCQKQGINFMRLDAPIGISPKTALRSTDQ